MNLVENKYEDKLLQDLQTIKPSTELLTEHKVAESYWIANFTSCNACKDNLFPSY